MDKNLKGYFPQSVPLKFGGDAIGNKSECHYIIGGRWRVTESDLEKINNYDKN